MKIRIKVRQTTDYLKIFNGMLNLTPTELSVLAAFIDAPEPRFISASRKRITEKLQLSGLNYYIAQLVRKKALLRKDDGYKIPAILLPAGRGSIEFVITYED